MIEPVPTSVTDLIAWAVIGLFLGGWALEASERAPRRVVRGVLAAAWGVFGGFWLLMIPHFAFVMRSAIETVLSALAVPGCLYAGYLLWRGRERLLTLSRAVAIMGVIYFPFDAIPILRQELIETVARQVHAVITALGYEAQLVEGPNNGYQSGILFNHGGVPLKTHIILACTGIGSITIFGGLIAALDAPLGRKLRAFGLAVGIIYVLNIVRNVFIAVAFGNQWFQFLVGPITAVTGYNAPLVSFFIADRILSQSLSVVALVGITWLVVRIVPEMLSVLEEAVYVVTRTEVDLHSALSIDARR